VTTEGGYTGHLQDMSAVADELRAMPLHSGLLPPSERAGYDAIERVIHRHQFHYHDCDSIDCKAMFIWNSAEMGALLTRAYERGLDARTKTRQNSASGASA